jgi:flavodoxin
LGGLSVEQTGEEDAMSNDSSTGIAGTVIVVCESQRGRAGKVAAAARDAARTRGFGATIGVIDDLAPATIGAADALIAGCWMPGKAPFGDEPMRRLISWIESLEPLNGKPIGVYCTYRFFPHTFADTATRTAETEHLLQAKFEDKGGKVYAKRAIHINSIEEDAAALVDAVLERVPAA